jgi:CcmD family protein
MNFLLEPGLAIYVAMAVALVVWIGIFVFIWRVDQQVRELRSRLDQPQHERHDAPRATIENRTGRANSTATPSE